MVVQADRYCEGVVSVGELTIGRMAKLNCVSEKALRLYHQKGLLAPVRTDEETGYRYYDIGQCATIDMIQQLRLLGFSLDEIGEIEQEASVEMLSERLKERLSAIDEQERRLAIAHKIGDDLASHCDIYLHRPPCNQIMLEHLPARPVLTFNNPDPRALGGDDGELAMRNWELNLRIIKQRIVEQGLPISLFRNVGCIIPLQRLKDGDLRFESSFVFVDETFGHDVLDRAVMLSGGTYLTMYCDNAIMETGKDTETVMVQRMLDYADHKCFELAGDYLGEVIADTPAFLFRRRDMFFRLCLPVRYAAQT